MKEKYVKPVANSEGQGKRLLTIVEPFLVGVAAGKAVKSAFGIKEYVERYAVLEIPENKVVTI